MDNTIPRHGWPAIRDGDRKIYIIVGQARSGTTFLARAIEKALLDEFGEAKKPYMEIEGDRISSINRLLFTMAKGDIWNPPPHEALREAGEKMKDFLANYVRFRNQHFWGFKDPRTSLTLPLWDEVIDHENTDVYVIATFRKPKRVIDALGRTNKGKEEEREAFVQEYNKRLLANLKIFLGLDDE